MAIWLIVVLSIFAFLLLVALAVSPRCWQSLYSGLIFGPDKATSYPRVKINNIEAEDVWFRSSGLRLHGWFFKQEKSRATVLIHHSNAGNVYEWTSLVEDVLETGASVFIYDYRGYGMSEGTPTVSGICKDGEAAYRYLVEERRTSPSNIVHLGSSLGGGVACEMAYNQPCGGLALHGAFSSLREMAAQLLPATRFIPSVFFFRPKMDNAARLARIKVPVLILHGRWDDMIRLEHAKRNLASAAGPKRLVELQAGHMDRGGEGVFAMELGIFIDGITKVQATA